MGEKPTEAKATSEVPQYPTPDKAEEHPAPSGPPYLPPPVPPSARWDTKPREGSAFPATLLGWDRKLLVSTETRLLCPGFPTW